MPLKKKLNSPEDEEDNSTKLWFANQLSDNTCVSMVTLNALLNMEVVELRERLREFRDKTERMSSSVSHSPICSFLIYLNLAAVDDSLAVLSAHLVQQTHNALAQSV